ncbi:MAG: sugar phosphate isomerase/epimerase [Magnetococcales bacterium]|nr:sugar phosphate isomerase/epimerase [Magnetococcales bacterium]
MKTKPLIGIMQGRMLPPYEGRFQAFPANQWLDEFHLAAQAGLHSIEWIYETYNRDKNPIIDDDGIAEIAKATKKTGVKTLSICADYFMNRQLVGENGKPNQENVEHLLWLIGQAEKLSMGYIVLPFVDSSSLTSEAERDGLVEVLEQTLPTAAKMNVELHLETDFTPIILKHFLERVDHPALLSNYDIGNSAALGYDPAEELTYIGDRLGSVHIKDRVLGGGTVPFGTGNANFATCFRLIEEIGLSYPYILQAARNEEIDNVSWAIQNRKFAEEFISAL